MARQLARRQRRERLAGIALAALGVVVLVVALIALRQPSKDSTQAGSVTSTKSAQRSSSAPTTTSTHPSSAAPSSSASSSASGSTSPASDGRLPLVVLNNTTVTGLAAQASDRFKAGGWTVTSFGNYQNDILSTCAYYDPSVPNAEQDARRLQAQFPAIKRVEPKFPELPAGPIVVVLTPDYS